MMVPAMAFISFALIPIVSATCYYTDGSIATAYNQTACDPSAVVSACCDQNDYCLSNGLCFDAGSNNLLAVQGCTDPHWSDPCHAYCPVEITLGNNPIPCPNSEDVLAGTISYCCGPNATSCCENGEAFSIPVGTIVLRPDQVPTSINPPSSSSTTTTNTSGKTSVSSKSSNSSTSKSLAIGLGVGLPIAFLLIGAILFLGRELRRYNNNRTLPRGGQPTTAQSTIGVDIAEIQKPTITSNLVGQELDAQNQVHELPHPRNV